MQLGEKIKTKTLEIKGDWHSLSKQLKEQFPYLTDIDLKFETGKEHELICRVKNRLYMSREDVIKIIEKYQTKALFEDRYVFQTQFDVEHDPILPTNTHNIVYRKPGIVSLLKRLSLLSCVL